MTLTNASKEIQSNRDFLTLKPEELVTSAYQALLRRDPDPGGLQNYSSAIRNGQNLLWLLQTLLRSEEFALKQSEEYLLKQYVEHGPLDTGPLMNVEMSATSPQEHRDAWLRRNSLELRADTVCAEYGCGVGRLTQWLAKRFRRVLAFGYLRTAS
jgi:hypothetical protein